MESWLKANSKWVEQQLKTNPAYFEQLKSGQNPNILWIGCSDSRVDPGTLFQADLGEFFVHRNIANQVYPDDSNIQSVIQFAVDSLKVPNIVICGHYFCGGVKAAANAEAEGVIAHWISPIYDLYRQKKSELEKISDKNERFNRLSELNVIEQVGAISKSPTIINAWQRKQHLTIHGWIFDLSTGYIKQVTDPLN